MKLPEKKFLLGKFVSVEPCPSSKSKFLSCVYTVE